MLAEKESGHQEQTGEIARKLDEAHRGRKKMWNRFIGYGLLGVVAGLGLFALSVATAGTASTVLLVGSNLLGEGGSLAFGGGLLARLFDKSPKKK